MQLELTQRQGEILRLVVEEYVATGQPVASRALVERAGLDVSTSTIRSELAELERRGLLMHPHTSAGRVPTDHGYRFFADRLLERLEPRPAEFPLQLAEARSELETALQSTTDMLSELTRLLALVSAPAVETATVRHVEVLLLQPHIVMTVVITSAGSVTKRLFQFDHSVDPGLVEWAGSYLNEQAVGTRLGSQKLRRRLEDSGLSALERSFLDTIRPVLEAPVADDQRMFVGGAASLLDDASPDELRAYRGAARAAGAPPDATRRRRRCARLAAAVRPGRRRARQSRAAGARARGIGVRPLDSDARHGEPARASTDGLRARHPVGSCRRLGAFASLREHV